MFELDNILTQFTSKLFEQIDAFGVNRNKFEFEIEPNKESWILQITGNFNAGYDRDGNLQVWEIEIKSATFCFPDFTATLDEEFVEQLKKYVTE